MVSADQIQEQIWCYLSGVVGLDQFEDWLAAYSWDMHKHAGKEAQDLVGAIELRLAEYSSGHLDHSDLRHELGMILFHGSKLPVGDMLIIEPLPGPTTTAVSRTSQGLLATQIVVFGGRLLTSAQTRSASGHNPTEREVLQAAS